MAQRSYLDAERQKEAHKLRELFKGRFSDDEALELLKNHGGLSEAVDFILNSDPDQVRRFIHDRNNALVDALRKDSASIQSALCNGVETSIRLFACQDCDNYWWRKVPSRKEVSKCRLCRSRYDPVPREQEWGLAEYVCTICNNVFWGSGWMNHTQSPCYNCQNLVCPKRIVPPTRPRNQKKRAEHSCTGNNCYNRATVLGSQSPVPAIRDADEGSDSRRGGGMGSRGGGRGRRRRGDQRRGYGDEYYGPVTDDNGFNLCANHRNVCPHERSQRQNKVLYPSARHISTGSTVNTFMSQGELAEDYDDLTLLPDVQESDED